MLGLFYGRLLSLILLTLVTGIFSFPFIPFQFYSLSQSWVNDPDLIAKALAPHREVPQRCLWQRGLKQGKYHCRLLRVHI